MGVVVSVVDRTRRRLGVAVFAAVALGAGLLVWRRAPAPNRVQHLAELSGRWMSAGMALLDRSSAALDPAKCTSVATALAELREGEADFEPMHQELLAALAAADALEQEAAATAAIDFTASEVAATGTAVDDRVPRLRAFHDACPVEAAAFSERASAFLAKLKGIDDVAK